MPSVLGPLQVFLRILLPFALGYYLSYFFRVINAVLSTDLAAELGLGPQDLGLLTAAYFITFAAAQLPLGLLLDRYGPQRIEAALLRCAALGSLLFALGDNSAHLIVIARASAVTSASIASRLGYANVRTPPIAGPRAVESIAMIASRPQLGSRISMSSGAIRLCAPTARSGSRRRRGRLRS